MAAVGQGWRPHKLVFSFTLTPPTHQKNKITSSKKRKDDRLLRKYDRHRPEDKSTRTIVDLTPLTKDMKYKRHIRSMSDVQSSTPCKLPFRSHRINSHALIYDSDTRNRLRIHNRYRYADSSDSSGSERPRKLRTIERNIMKPPDSMRIL
ncbi:hypothetical protein EVAR_33677_1 [Eumeta japonica]|uniref:Uncharacterized protein n=1 Tax=Eumeta variegata TaxID=151549 RepID=A0A4C1VN50_EUMVA|nr:hypothetical protein EVAR_33677_1 [Eumeta japonica]